MKPDYTQMAARLDAGPVYNQLGIPIALEGEEQRRQNGEIGLIRCQACEREFKIMMAQGVLGLDFALPKGWEYGDPPFHYLDAERTDPCVGNTMLSIPEWQFTEWYGEENMDFLTALKIVNDLAERASGPWQTSGEIQALDIVGKYIESKSDSPLTQTEK
jgi:hypothetical protein